MPPRPVFATPDATEQAFYDALTRGDVEGLMQLWSDDEEVCCIHPGGGRLFGADAIKQSWLQILDRGGMNIQHKVLSRIATPTMAVHQVLEEIMVTQPQGVGEIAFVIATNVYLAGPQGWSLVLHHGTATAAAADDNDAPTVLH